MSQTFVLYPILNAMVKAEGLLGKPPSRAWGTHHPKQDWLVALLRNHKIHEEARHIPEIASLAARTADEVNAFLRARGSGISLLPFMNPADFGAAGVLDLGLEWRKKGERREIRTHRHTYPAVRLRGNSPREGILFFRDRKFPHPITCLRAKTGEEVFLTVLDPSQVPDFFVKHPEKVLPTSASLTLTPEFGGVVFPMVSLDQANSINWLKGMQTMDDDERPAIVSQTKQQIRFRMNELGARTENAVAVGATRGFSFKSPPPDLVIDQPFLCWVMREELSLPLFAAYITEDDWKDPGAIGR